MSLSLPPIQLSYRFLNEHIEGASTTSSGSPFQPSITLWEKKLDLSTERHLGVRLPYRNYVGFHPNERESNVQCHTKQ